MTEAPAKFKFRLYVVADTQNSAQAVANLTAFCDAKLTGRHEIEIVDVFKEPARAIADGVLMTPTLIRLAPPIPPKKIIGTLGQSSSMLLALGLAPLPE